MVVAMYRWPGSHRHNNNNNNNNSCLLRLLMVLYPHEICLHLQLTLLRPHTIPTAEAGVTAMGTILMAVCMGTTIQPLRTKTKERRAPLLVANGRIIRHPL